MILYPPGYLAYGALPKSIRVRPCPCCGGDERERGWNERCEKCASSEGVQAAYRRRRAREQRKNYQRRRTGTTLPTGRPRG